MKKNIFLILIFVLAACVPVNNKVEYAFAPLSEQTGLELTKPFDDQLKMLGIRLGPGLAYQYNGNDSRAFLFVVDRFYLEHPGFCPLAENGFLYLENNTGLFMSLAAPIEPQTGNPVIALVYDQNAKPKLRFVSLQGSSRTILPVTKCINPAQSQK